jgi:hypothetical protein
VSGQLAIVPLRARALVTLSLTVPLDAPADVIIVVIPVESRFCRCASKHVSSPVSIPHDHMLVDTPEDSQRLLYEPLPQIASTLTRLYRLCDGDHFR